MKKFLINLLLVIMMISASFFVGCSCGGGGDDDGDGPSAGPGTPPPAPTPTIELKTDTPILTVGDYSKVTATNYVTVEGQSLVFTSSNQGIIKVDAQGNVEAISEGAAIVSVAYGEAKDQITITATYAGLIPELKFDGLQSRSLSNVDTDQINPYIIFNQRRFGFDEGLTVEYSSSNTDLITVNQSGVVTGVPNAKGDATITVKASWRGFTSAQTFSLQKEIAYHVDYNTLFIINDDTAKTYEVYTKAEFEGTNYQNVIDFVCTAKYGDENINAEDVTVTIANEDMVSFADGKLTGKAFGTDGKTTATLSFEKDGTTYKKVIPITVTRPVASYKDRIKYFSNYTGNYKDENDSYIDKSLTKTVFGEDEIVDIYQGENRLELDENGNVLGVQGNFDSVADVTLRIGTQTECYDVSVDVYTKVVQNAKDIENTFNISKEKTFVTGYCEMIADVDMKNYEFKHEGYYHATVKDSSVGGFRGVFNGNGYSISNFQTRTASKGGMFLYIQAYQGNNPVIKNVAFNDITLTNGGSVVALAVTAPTQFENIYIKTTSASATVNGALLPTYSEANVKMRNVFIDVPSSVTINPVTEDLQAPGKATGNAKYGFGSLFANLGLVTDKSVENFNNVFVVSPMPLTYYEGNDIRFTDATFIKNYNNSEDKDPTLTVTKKDANNKAVEVTRYNPYYYQYGANQTKTWDNKEIPKNSTFQNYEKYSVKTGAFYYESFADLTSSRADLSSFVSDASECWIVKNGVPIWRSMDKESYYTTENGNLYADAIVLNEEKKNTTIGITNYTDVDFEVTNAVSNNDLVTATVNSDGKTITLNVVDGYEDWDNEKDIEVTVTFTDETTKTLVVKVALKSIIEKINDEFLFSAQDGAFYDNNVVAHSDIAEAYQVKADGNLSTLNLTKEGYMLGVQTNITNGFKDVGAVTIRVLTKKGLWYQFTNVKAYTGILTKGEHLKWFQVESFTDKHQGHYLVGNNIDAKNVGITHIVNDPNSTTAYYSQIPSTVSGGFQGIFDGRGYTIENMFAFRNGIFGRIFNDEQGTTEIKNVAFTKVIVDSLASELADGKKHVQGALFARFTPDTVLDDNYVAKYQTVISNVYVQTKVPEVGPAYQGSVFKGIFDEYCEHNLVNDGPEDTPSSTATKIPLDKRGQVVSFKLVDCFFDYSNSNQKIGEKNVGGSGGGLIVTNDIGAVYVDDNDVPTYVSEEIKNSRYDNVFIASEYPLAVKRTSQKIPGFEDTDCPNTVLVSEVGTKLYVTYASTMNGKAGYKGWEWIPYEVAKADPTKYNEAILNGHLPSWMEEHGIDYRICGQTTVFHETITFTGDASVDNDVVTKGTLFYTNVNQYGTLNDMATAYASNNNLYSGYDTTYWSFDGGKLTWKGAGA